MMFQPAPHFISEANSGRTSADDTFRGRES